VREGDTAWREELAGMKPEEAAVLTLLRARLRKSVGRQGAGS
jgi:hypothetical protein